MAKARELETEFWTALKSDMTMMLGLIGVEEGHTRPMTAQMKGLDGPIWFFSTRANTLVQNLGGDGRAVATFASKGHELFASIHGRLTIDDNPDTIDELWNPFVAAWYEGGKDDPELVLLRFDAERAEIWQNENSIFAGLKMLFGHDPKEDYKDKVAEVSLN